MFNSKTLATLVIKLALVVIPALILMLGIDVLYRRSYLLVYEWPESVLPHPAIEEKYHLVKVGNSHALDGISLKSYCLKSLDLATAAQKFEMDLAILKQHQRQIADGAVILINVSPISFSHTAANSQKGIQSVYYGRVSPFYIPNLNWGDYLESEFFPFVRSGFFWRKKHTDAVRERIAAEEKGPQPTVKPVAAAITQVEAVPVPSVQPTPSRVPQATKVLAVEPDNLYYNVEALKLELASPSATANYMDNKYFTYDKWLKTDEFSPDYFEINQQDLEKLIDYTLAHNWRPVLITVPISQSLQEALPADYLQTYVYDRLAETNLQGVEYIDYTDLESIATNSAYYSNSDHLNQTGAAIFSYLLLQDLIHKGYLPPEADGYDYGPLYKIVYR